MSMIWRSRRLRRLVIGTDTGGSSGTVRKLTGPRRRSTVDLPVPDRLFQPVEERPLAGEDPFPRLVGREPRGAVDLGILLLAPGARRPLHPKRVARDRGGVDVALGPPGGDDLA